MNDRLTQIAQKASTDFYFFCKEVLGYSKMSESPHQELCNHLLSKKRRKKLTLMPRGSFKSTVGASGFPIWELIHNPNLRILIASETQKNAIKYVKEIKEHFESNQKLRALFGDFVAKGNTWRDYEFIVGKRERIFKEPSVMASSLEKGTIVGMHFDIIILDDVVSRNNINTPEQIQKTLDYYKLLNSILEPNGRIIINGTRWSVFDLYGWILDPDNGENSQFETLVKEAIDKEGNLLMPKVLTRTFLEEQKKSQGDWIFSAQYQNNPISSEIQTFKFEHVQYYEKPPNNMIYFMTVDYAVSTKERSDYTAIIVNGVDYHHNWYVQEAIQLKMDPHDVVAELFRCVEKYQPLMCVGMEKFMLEKVFKVILEREMERRGVHFPIKDLPTNNRISKEARIRALQPRFEQKQIYIKKDHKELAHQIMYHPQVKHDDLLDALKSQIQITFPSDKPSDLVPEKYGHLTPAEAHVWKEVDTYVKRKVKRTKWTTI